MGRTIAISLLATDRMSRTFDRAASSTGRLSGALERVDKVGQMTGLAVGAASAVALTRALVPLTAVAAALPSALASVAAVSTTLKTGMVGVGEAMKAVGEGDAKKLDKALKNLAPSARAFVKESGKIVEEWDKIRKRVQQNLFAGMAKQVRGLGSTLLPTVSKGMSKLAADLNDVGIAAIKTMKTGWFRGRVAMVFNNASQATRNMTGAVRPLMKILMRLAVLGGPLVNQFTKWAASGIKAADAWMANSDNAAKVVGSFQGIGRGLSQVGKIVKNLIAFLGGVIGASKEFNLTSGDMLDTLEKMTAAMAAWSNSAEGQKQMGDIFRLLADVANSVAQIMPIVGQAITLVVQAIGNLPGPVREGVVQFLAWSVVISLLVGRLKLLLAVAAGFKAIKAGFTAINSGIKGMQAGVAAARGFAAGFRNVNAAFSATASRATILGAALRSQLMRWRQLTAAMLRNAKAALANAASWIKLKVAAAGAWIANVTRAVASWAVALYRAAAAATANAVAQLRMKAAAAGAWIMGVVRATISWAVALGRAAMASRAMAIANALLNVVLRANPIILIITLIIALGAAFVLAYKKVGWFRTMVDGIFKFLKTAVTTVVNFVKNHWRLIIPIVLGPLGIILGLVTKYWTQIKNFVTSAVKGVINFVKSHWRLIITIVLGPLGLVVSLVTKYWNNIKSNVTRAVKGIISFVKNHWRLIIGIIGGPLLAAIGLVTKHWTSIKNRTASIWNGIKAHLQRTLDNIKRGFGAAVDGISRVWNGLRNAAKKPVNFVLGIYNRGVKPMVEKLAGLVGKKVSLPHIPAFASGGVMPGYSPGKDSLLAAVSPGESIFRPEFTRAVGSDWVNSANNLARRGGANAVRSWLVGGEGAGFARGGVAGSGHVRGGGFAGSFGFGGIVGGLVKGLKDFAFDNVEKAVMKSIGKILGGSVPGSGQIRDLIAGIPGWIKNALAGWVKKNLDGLAGGKGMKGALAWAKTQHGKPYQWGGNGNPSWDCSGFMSAIESVIRGQKPHRRWATSSFNGGTPPGWHRNKKSGFMIGVLDNGNAHASHTAGTLLGTNVESSGSRGVRVGSSARGYKDGMFPWRYGFKADTGALTLQPGWNPPVFNGTGKPELLATPPVGAGSGETHFHFHGPVGSRIEIQNWLARALDDLKRQGRMR